MKDVKLGWGSLALGSLPCHLLKNLASYTAPQSSKDGMHGLALSREESTSQGHPWELSPPLLCGGQ